MNSNSVIDFKLPILIQSKIYHIVFLKLLFYLFIFLIKNVFYEFNEYKISYNIALHDFLEIHLEGE